MIRRVALVLCLLAATGCRKKGPQYYEAQGRYDVITARLGDDAYADEEMNNIEALLRAVPEKARESERAKALLTAIGIERMRIANEAAARAKPVAAAAPQAYPTGPSVVAFAAPTAAIAAVDAGFVGQIGMKFDVFLAAYGNCMDPAEDVLMPGANKPARAVSVRRTPACFDKFGGTPKVMKLFVFVDDKLAGEASRSEPDSSKPYAGMTSEVFMREFGNCMSAGPDITMPGATTPSQAFNVRKDKECTDRFGGSGDGVTKSFVFNNGKLVGETNQVTSPKTPVIAPGTPPVMNPGSTMPSGVNSALPPPDPSTAFTPDSNTQQH